MENQIKELKSKKPLKKLSDFQAHYLSSVLGLCKFDSQCLVKEMSDDQEDLSLKF